MKVSFLSVAGIDSSVPTSKLVNLFETYGNKIEFGVLLKKYKQDEFRYPLVEWITDFVDIFANFDARISLHLCSSVCRDFVDSAIRYDVLREVIPKIKRVQLNI